MRQYAGITQPGDHSLADTCTCLCRIHSFSPFCVKVLDPQHLDLAREPARARAPQRKFVRVQFCRKGEHKPWPIFLPPFSPFLPLKSLIFVRGMRRPAAPNYQGKRKNVRDNEERGRERDKRAKTPSPRWQADRPRPTGPPATALPFAVSSLRASTHPPPAPGLGGQAGGRRP